MSKGKERTRNQKHPPLVLSTISWVRSATHKLILFRLLIPCRISLTCEFGYLSSHIKQTCGLKRKKGAEGQFDHNKEGV